MFQDVANGTFLMFHNVPFGLILSHNGSLKSEHLSLKTGLTTARYQKR